MKTLLAQIAPQRSTQYADLAAILAPHELSLSPLGQAVSAIAPIQLGGQDYLKFNLPQVPDDQQARELGALAMTSGYFIYHEQIGGAVGPWLRPIETHFEPALPLSLLMTRRYRGKTNEMFTHFMCNLARFSSGFVEQPWRNLRVFDPLAGGGTTLFAALMLGADVAGVEENHKGVDSTTGYLREFMRQQRIGCQDRKERIKGAGQRWRFTLGRRKQQQGCLLARGDTRQSQALISGFHPHLIVTDLPYGIQHQGELINLLADALPMWAKMLPCGGVLTLAWEATRFPRTELIALVESVRRLRVLNAPPYNALAHRVDRVIKQRDVLVARVGG